MYFFFFFFYNIHAAVKLRAPSSTPSCAGVLKHLQGKKAVFPKAPWKCRRHAYLELAHSVVFSEPAEADDL